MMRGLKCANVPLVTTMPNFPSTYKALTELSKASGKVVGLTCTPDVLRSIRAARANTALGRASPRDAFDSKNTWWMILTPPFVIIIIIIIVHHVVIHTKLSDAGGGP